MKTQPASGPFMKVSEVAVQLGVSRPYVYRLISRGVIPAVRIANAIRIPRGAWELWLRGQDRAAIQAMKDASA